MMKTTRCALALFLASAIAATALAEGIPDLGPSWATSASGRIEIAPDGSGPALADRGLSITVVVLDGNNFPVPGYPWQDIWVWNVPGETGINVCNGGSLASGNTDGTGTTTIEGPFYGGGITTAGLQVYIAGVALDPLVSPPLDIVVVSADLNGDLAVDLADLTTVPGGFANLFLNGVYDHEVDFNSDDAEDILDVVRFAELFLGQATCP